VSEHNRSLQPGAHRGVDQLEGGRRTIPAATRANPESESVGCLPYNLRQLYPIIRGHEKTV
jgi:hypothetical protein